LPSAFESPRLKRVPAGSTVIVTLAVPVLPKLSVTVSVAVYSPSAAYV